MKLRWRKGSPDKTAEEIGEAPAKELEPAAEVEVARSPVRCPYCHDGCTAEDLSAIVCQKCLSRHHGACWREAGKCASCGSTRALRGEVEVEVAPAERELLRRGLPRDAVLKVMKRCEVSEADATRVLLHEACDELRGAGLRRQAIWAGVTLAIVGMFFLWVIILSVV